VYYQDFQQQSVLTAALPPSRKEKEKTTPFGVNLLRSQVLYRAAPASFNILTFEHLQQA